MPPDVRIAFSQAADGDQRLPARRGAWIVSLGISRLAVPRQVHGTVIVDAGASAAELDRADGLVSDDPRLALGVFGADCPGLCIAAPDALGVAHCGWRGVAAGIVTRLVDALAARSAHPRSRWHAFIGPGIRGPAYEVDAPVLAARAWPIAALAPRANGRASLDLPTAIIADLAHAGIAHATASGRCTHEDSRLHSYRWDGPGITQLLVAWRS